jgi:hypothetical protein
MTQGAKYINPLTDFGFKKVFGNEGNYYNEFKKWLPKEDTNTSVNPTDEQTEHIKKSDVITNKNPNDSENTWGF